MSKAMWRGFRRVGMAGALLLGACAPRMEEDVPEATPTPAAEATVAPLPTVPPEQMDDAELRQELLGAQQLAAEATARAEALARRIEQLEARGLAGETVELKGELAEARESAERLRRRVDQLVERIQVRMPRSTPEPQFDPMNPDWKLRYAQLKAYYQRRFEAPVVGQDYDVMLMNGQVRPGRLLELTDTGLTLGLREGSVTLVPENLAESSRAEFFREHYAHLNALARGRVEYARWQAMREAASRPEPTATPVQVAVSGRPWPPKVNAPPAAGVEVGGDDGVNVRHRIDTSKPPPQNEGPRGRVWQVDQYIRKHAAIPHSLRYLSWGRVQRQSDGNYTVDVRYTLESAEGLGTSTENMRFFMYADGTVYRRAGIK